MFFDARAAKLLQPGQHMVIDGCNGLRLVASATRKSWIYRYKDPSNGLMKQAIIGQWPATSAADAAAQWLVLRNQRAVGDKPVPAHKAKRLAQQQAAVSPGAYTVRMLVDDFVVGHLVVIALGWGPVGGGCRISRRCRRCNRCWGCWGRGRRGNYCLCRYDRL